MLIILKRCLIWGETMKLNKESIKYIILGVCCLLILALGEAAILFEPLYEDIYYGTLSNMFFTVIRAIIWAVGIITMVIISKKVLKFNPLRSPKESRKEELPIKNLIALTLITTACIALLSGLVGWQVKILADLGERYTGLMLELSAATWACNAVKILVAIMMINFFQEGMEKSKFNKHIPWGGLLLLLTFGLYELIMGSTNYPLVYLLYTLVYGEIHLLTHKNTIKSFLLIYLIYLL